MSEWQPIDTAPKDGTTIVCWDVYAIEPYTAHWYSASGRFVPVWDGGAVLEYQSDFGTEYKSCDPTHWQPLPVQPEDDE